MKRFLLIISCLFLIATSASAQTIKVKAIENFSSIQPSETFDVETIKYEHIFDDYFLEPGTTISGKVVNVRKPKHGSKDSCFEFKPISYTYNGKTTNISQIQISGLILGYKPIDPKATAINVTRKVANFFLKGLIYGVDFVQGAAQAESGQRIKSGAQKVYKDSFFYYLRVGNELNVKNGDIVVLKLKKQFEY